MRPDPASPALVVLELLHRADELGAAAGLAIRAGNDAALFAILDERSDAIDAAIRSWRSMPPSARSAELRAQVDAATRTAIHSGLEARHLAMEARDQAVGELSALETRELAAPSMSCSSVVNRRL
jgi:hypothetical protein